MNRTILDRNEIKKIIPHRDPMLLIDAVTELVPGEKIKATFHVDPTRDIFAGHFPGNPVLPGIYTVEMMAQAADIMLMSTASYQAKTPYFIGIDKVRFKSKILPGDDVIICASVLTENVEKSIITCRAEVYVENNEACTGEVTLAMR